MRRNTSSTDSTTFGLADGETRSRGALVGSLLLLAASFALLVLAPVLLGRFQSASQSMNGGFLPIAAASGIALGGGAAMIAVVARLVRDIEARPYAGLAPVLAVFAGFVLWGVRAQLPLYGVQSEYAGVFALMVSVAGGAIVARPGAMSRLAGWALAFFGPITLLMLVWGASGKGELGEAVRTLTPQVKMFLGLSAGCAFAMVVLGEAARVLSRNVRPVLHVDTRDARDQREDGPVRLMDPAPRISNSFAATNQTAEPLFRAPALRGAAPIAPSWGNRNAPGQTAPSASYDYAPQNAEEYYTPDAPAPHVNVWEQYDEDLTLPKRFAWWKALFLVLVLAGGTGAAVYYGMILPNRAKEQAAAEGMQQKRVQIQAEAEREAAAKRAIESKADAARLEAMLAGPAVVAPAPAEGQAAEAAPAADAPVAAGAAGAAAAAPEAPLEARPAVSVEQLKPEAKRSRAKRERARGEEPRLSPSRPLNNNASDDPIYGL